MPGMLFFLCYADYSIASRNECIVTFTDHKMVLLTQEKCGGRWVKHVIFLNGIIPVLWLEADSVADMLTMSPSVNSKVPPTQIQISLLMVMIIDVSHIGTS